MCWSVCTEDRSKFMDLSVIIHGHDGQSHIAGCLRSVTRCPREHIDMECIVVGAASRMSVLRSYTDMHSGTTA